VPRSLKAKPLVDPLDQKLLHGRPARPRRENAVEIVTVVEARSYIGIAQPGSIRMRTAMYSSLCNLRHRQNKAALKAQRLPYGKRASSVVGRSVSRKERKWKGSVRRYRGCRE